VLLPTAVCCSGRLAQTSAFTQLPASSVTTGYGRLPVTVTHKRTPTRNTTFADRGIAGIVEGTTPFISVGGSVVTASTQTAVTVIGSRVPIDFADRVRRAAEADERTVSQFIRRALRHEVERVNTDHERTAA
jgi:hypothetical protein